MCLKRILCLKLLCLLLISCKSTSQTVAEKPNIILIMADDQGWGDTGYNGHPFLKTPNLDKMAKNSLRLDRFYAGAPVCSPTRASVMTGRTPMRTKVLNHGHYMRPQEETIAEALKRAGYVTGHFGKWHIGSVQKQSPVSPGNSGFDEWISAPNYYDIDPYLSKNGNAQRFKGESSNLTVDWTVDFIKRKAKGEAPFFAICWFSAPHWPFEVLPPDTEMYKGKKNPGYFQEITVMDREIGRIRKALRDNGVADNTLVWFCSDNGGLAVESSGGREKKGSIYEGGLRVPCLIEWPAKIKPARNASPTITSDIYPTLLELVGIKPSHSHPLDGESLMPLVNGKSFTRKDGMGFWHHFTNGQSTYSDRIVKEIMEKQQKGVDIAIPYRIRKDIDEFKQYSMTSFPGHAAYTLWPYKVHRIEKGKKVTFELYNLIKDPMEAKNLIDLEKEKAGEMKAILDKWQKSVINSLNGKDYKNTK